MKTHHTQATTTTNFFSEIGDKSELREESKRKMKSKQTPQLKQQHRVHDCVSS